MMQPVTNSAGALKGIVVADFTQLAQGPWATQMLGDMGAEIIKIEPPQGDWMRRYAYSNLYPRGESISFLSFNRNKFSIALDLKNKKSVDAVRKIIEKSDILIENFRPGVMERLGLGYEDIKQIKPDIIYCSSSGYGSGGPYVNRPGQDLLAQSISGAPTMNGKQGDIPVVTAVGQADLLTSLFIVQSVLAALYYRSQTGKGQKIEACLMNSIISFHTQEITTYLAERKMPERSSSGIPNPWLGAPYGIYHTADGYIAIGMNSVKKLAAIMGIEKYNTDEYISNNIITDRDRIKTDFDNVFQTRKTDEWLPLLLQHDIWCSQVNTLEDMIQDEQVRYNNMIIGYEHPLVGKVETTGFPVIFSESPQSIRSAPPLLGEHTAHILRKYAGYSESEIAEMMDENSTAKQVAS